MLHPLLTTLTLLLTLAFGTLPSTSMAENYLSDYSGGSGLTSSVDSNFSNGGGDYGDSLLFSGGGNYVAINTSCCAVDAPHRAAHQQKLQARKAEAARLADLPPPCGNYLRAPRACKNGRRR